MISPSITDAEQARLVATRRDLHAHPELGFEETRTQALVLERLVALGLTPRRVAGTGVIADVAGTGGPGKTVLLRADLDGLPLTEENDVGYRSTLTHQPQSATSGRGAWVDGKWAVVFVRPLRTTDPLDYTFSAGGKGQAVFAGWNGSAGNRGGRKQWSTWVDFEVGP